MGDILVGTASWTDKTLLKSGWYPKDAASAEERLRYYATHFPLVESDASYYFLPTEKNSELWVKRTPKEFTFNMKAFSLLTQHPTRANALKGFDVAEDKKRIYPKDLDAKVIDRVWDAFLDALQPLLDADKLGVLLFQFPPWFTISRKNKDYILECAKRAAPIPLAVEFRSELWMTEDNQEETLDFLEGHGITYVCVDMPQGFKSSIPPVLAATADLAMVRFHGHNDDGWESNDIYKRFGYLYPDKELEEWAPRVEELSSQADRTHVLMNNCYRDYAQSNARQLSQLLHDHGAPLVEPAAG